MKLYQYAIIFHPKQTKQQKDDGIDPVSKIVKDITSILAPDDKSALLIIAREIPTEYTDKLSQVEIALRPF